MKQKLLITGANGFLGSHAVKYFSDEYHVTALTRNDCDLSDAHKVKAFFKNKTFDFILNFAAFSKPGREKKDFLRHEKDTIYSAINLYEYAPKDTTLVLFFGTSDEYGNQEGPFHEKHPLKPISPYGIAKVKALEAIQKKYKEINIPYTYLRLFLCFGENQNSNLFLPALIKTLLHDQNFKMTLGEQIRDFNYVQDILFMIKKVLKNPDKAIGEVFNLTTQNEKRIVEVARLVQKLIGKGTLDIGALPYREKECMRLSGINKKFIDCFGAIEVTNFEEALRKTIESYKTSIN